MVIASRRHRPAANRWRTGLLSLLLLGWAIQVPDLFPSLGQADPARSAAAALAPSWQLEQHYLRLEVRLPAATPLAVLIERLDGHTIFAQRLHPQDAAHFSGTMDLSSLPDGLYLLRLKAGGQTRSRLILL